MALIRGLLAALALCIAAPVSLAQHGSEPMHHGFTDAERWSREFDDPARDAWQKPEQVVRALSLAPDAAVADIGAGTGYFSVRLARAVPRGVVYGADIEPGMVHFLEQRAAREKLGNVRGVLAGGDTPNLPAPVDLVLIVDTYHHLEQRSRYFSGLKQVLKPGARVAIIDFRPDSPVGPPPPHRIGREQVTREMGEAGYRLVADHSFLPNQYFLVFAPR